MKKLDCLVTGIGVVTPAGIDKRQFWAHIKRGLSFIDPITRFDSSLYSSRIAGQIHDLDNYSNVNPRLLKKIDLFSHIALVSADSAFKDANIDLSKEDLKRFGIFMGNALGGWFYAETELRDLYLEGREGVSPYMASAWFPAAPQGQVSINFGIKGYSKTVVADRASSSMAICYGARVLSENKDDVVIAGGMEAPVTPYALLCCNTYGALSKNNDNPRKAYKPFDKNRDGFVIGEGAGLVVMEREDRARKRGVSIYGKITGYGYTCDGYDRINPNPKPDQLVRAIKIALDSAGYKPKDIDYICADGAATKIGDATEAQAINQVFNSHAKNLAVSAPKSMFGNLLGASGAVDLIVTLLAMQHNRVPPTINLEQADPECDLNHVANKSIEKDINKALVISRGRGGINSVIAVEKV